MAEEIEFKITTKTMTPKEFKNGQEFGEKSWVGMAVAQCPVTGHIWETEELLFDKRPVRPFSREPRDKLHKYEFIGQRPLPEVQKMFDKGYVALVEIDPAQSSNVPREDNPEGTMNLEDVYRTGNIVWMRATVAKDMLGLETPLAFIAPDAVAKIKSIPVKA